MSDYDSLISTVPGGIATAESVRRRIRLAIEGSPVPEDPVHSLNTLQWLLQIAPHADEALRIAALGHDIDRAAGPRRVRKADFEDFEEFKAAHAKNSAQILLELLEECGVEKAVREEVFRLVCLHETGGDERSNLLRDADSLSFFEVNLPHYFARHGMEAALERSVWGYMRLSRELQGVVKGFSYDDERLNTLVQQVVAAVEE